MLLTSLLKDLSFEHLKGSMDLYIQSLEFDSREIKPGSLFIAIPGFIVDGHDFINQAIENGATTIIIEKDISIEENITVLKVPNARMALAQISTNFYESPASNLNLIGITGTNGKTSTTYFIKSIYEQAKKDMAIIGTTGTIINNKLYETKNTTPESLDLQKFFTLIKKENVDNCIMEVSSHALNLHRVAYTNYDTSIFTNLSPDHLELHKNMEDYFQAKAKLFKQTQKFNIINYDDPYGKRLVQILRDYDAKTITYGIYSDADIFPSDIKYSFTNTTFKLNTPTGQALIKLNIPGEIYLYNCLAAISCAYCNDIPLSIIQEGINQVTNIQGRFEVIYEKEDFKIIIDFAHTEDALEKTLNTIRPYVKGRIILVFGVYADMSNNGKMKRIGMGRVAAQHADFSIITSDNPKHHDQHVILNEISDAMESYNGNYKSIVNREHAIHYAINSSEENDVVIITGKGHENSQIIGDQNIPFNEKEIALDALASKV